MRLRRYKAAEELFEVVNTILEENDGIDPTQPRSAKLPSEWRRPLVRAFNNYCDATGRDRAYWRKKRRQHES